MFLTLGGSWCICVCIRCGWEPFGAWELRVNVTLVTGLRSTSQHPWPLGWSAENRNVASAVVIGTGVYRIWGSSRYEETGAWGE